MHFFRKRNGKKLSYKLQLIYKGNEYRVFSDYSYFHHVLRDKVKKVEHKIFIHSARAREIHTIDTNLNK